MNVRYNIYSNNGSGGPVDRTSAIAQVSGLTYQPAILGSPSDWIFEIRAVDLDTGFESRAADCWTRIVIDDSANDVTLRPNKTNQLRLSATSGPGIEVEFNWYGSPLKRPTHFDIFLVSTTVTTSSEYWFSFYYDANWFKTYLGFPSTPDALFETSPIATVSYSRGKTYYRTEITGLTAGAEYYVGVRAVNDSGHDGQTQFKSIILPAGAPNPVENLSISLDWGR